MKSNAVKMGAVVLGIALFAGLSIAGTEMKTSIDATQSIATIMISLNHFPSDADKEALMAIANDSANSKAIQTIATAVHNFEHMVSAADKESLNMIVEDSSATDAEKTLASIAAGISHTASPDAKTKLVELQ
jgi:bifunctional N-acetylglucosamine-1-phosphate-uridyltransferase/glucosamine-1-phosphate-acetyltransferase GlmU-like protein